MHNNTANAALPESASGACVLITPDISAWDAFVRSHPAGHMLQSTAWGALKAGAGWQSLRLALTDGSRILAGAQVLLRYRYGLSVAYIPRGPLFSGIPSIDTQFLRLLDRQIRRRRAICLRIEPNVLEGAPGSDELHSFLLLHDSQPVEPIQPRSTLHLDLTPPPEQLLAAMSKGHRADIRRAAREGVQVREGTQPADLEAFYTIMQATATRAEFGIHNRSYYAAAWNLFNQHARLWLAERAGETLAAALTFAWAGSGLYLYGGSTEAGLKSGANHAIQWHAIQWAREQGCRIYDFWGIPDALGRAEYATTPEQRAQLEEQARTDPIFGMYRFKRGFGGRIVRYLPAYDRIYIAPLYRIWQKTIA